MSLHLHHQICWLRDRHRADNPITHTSLGVREYDLEVEQNAGIWELSISASRCISEEVFFLAKDPYLMQCFSELKAVFEKASQQSAAPCEQLYGLVSLLERHGGVFGIHFALDGCDAEIENTVPMFLSGDGGCASVYVRIDGAKIEYGDQFESGREGMKYGLLKGQSEVLWEDLYSSIDNQFPGVYPRQPQPTLYQYR